MTLSDIRLRNRIAAVASTALFMWVLSPAGFSQSANASRPKVGTIEDYPATGLMTGCGNVYFYKASVGNPTVREGAVTGGTLPNGQVSATTAQSGDANYVFLSRGDGTHAWMNLNGRDVRLRKIKSRGDREFRRYSYSYRDVRITVELEDFTPQAGETDHTHRMRITLRRGRKVRVVQAVGGSDC